MPRLIARRALARRIDSNRAYRDLRVAVDRGVHDALARARASSPYVLAGTEGDVEISEAAFRQKMLASQETMTDWLVRWVKRDELQRWLQLGATLAIPLSAAIWRAIFRAGRRSKSS